MPLPDSTTESPAIDAVPLPASSAPLAFTELAQPRPAAPVLPHGHGAALPSPLQKPVNADGTEIRRTPSHIGSATTPRCAAASKSIAAGGMPVVIVCTTAFEAVSICVTAPWRAIDISGPGPRDTDQLPDAQ